MEPEEYVEGLSGEEIINDVLDQVEAKLRGDCNLRANDSYDGGYDGWVEVHLKLRGFDAIEVKQKLIVSAPPSATYQGETGSGEQSAAIAGSTVTTRIDIPLEPRLNVVRERSGQGVPTLTKEEETGQTVVKKRHYARKSTVTAGN